MKQLLLFLLPLFALNGGAQSFPDTLSHETNAPPATTVRDTNRLRLSPAPKQSKTRTFPNRFWLDVSGGVSEVGGLFGLGAGANVHYLDRNRRHYELRYVYTEDFVLLSNTSYGVSDAGYLSGWMWAGKHSLLEIAIGVSCVWGYEPGKVIPGMWWDQHRTDRFVTVGLPFEFDAKLMAGHYAGLGVSVKANLNPHASYALLGVELTIWGPN